ncbi:MAG: BACON domain-containing carbohydrate-binding protein [Bacteroidales bacterium]|jgi:hypothetical protein
MIRDLKKIYILLIAFIALVCVSCQPEPTLTLSSSTVEVPFAGSETTITVTSNTSWSISGGGGWCSIVPSSGEGTATVRLVAAKNTSNADRSTTITVIAGTLSGSVAVSQKQNDALILTKKTENLDNSARTISVELKSNITYDIIMPAGVTWITKVASKSFDTYNHEFAIAKNTAYDSRSAKIIFKDKSSTLADTLTINQSQLNAIILTSKIVNMPTAGGNIDVELRTNVLYDFQILGDDSWVSHLGTKGLSTYTHQFFIARNSTFDNRTSKVVFKEKNGSMADTLIINQQMMFALLLSKENFYIQKSGGSFNYSVQSNTENTVTISGGTGWITQIRTKGLVTSDYTFTVSPNTGSTDRTAMIIFAQNVGTIKDTINIKQSGFDGYYIYEAASQTLASLVPVADRAGITRLKIEGFVKADDFTTIRENIRALKDLDLSSAKIEDDKVPDYAFKSTLASPVALETVIFPSTLITIGKEAFYNCLQIKSLTLPANLATIDDYAYATCSNLAGHIEFPAGLNKIGEYAFANCLALNTVRLPNSLKVLNSFAFSGCSALNKVYSKIAQPYVISNVFPGLNADADLIVPAGTLSAYQLTAGWGYTFFKRIYEEGTSPESYIVIIENRVQSTGDGDTKTLTIQASAPWVMESCPSWVTPSKTSGTGSTTMQIKFDAYTGSTLRQGNFVIKLTGTTIKSTAILEQTNINFEDGDYVKIQSASQGAGVNIVFMGDGYSLADMMTKKYENNIREAVGHFFNVEPYRTYAAYFNVYMVYAFSQESGISDLTRTYNTVFEAKYTKEPPGTGMSINTTTCFTYALYAPVVDKNKTLIVVVTNSTRYAGTAWLFSNGAAVAICPRSSSNYPYDFRGIVQHEAGGHGFGKLADEYVNTTGPIPQTNINTLKQWQGYGHYLNVDVTSDLNQILWKHFIGLPNYSPVGAYEGGYYYSQGVWRAENRSAMINNIDYYSTASREMIVKRIKSLAGQTYSLEDFKSRDVVETSPATKAAGMFVDPLMQLAPPVMVVGSPK